MINQPLDEKSLLNLVEMCQSLFQSSFLSGRISLSLEGLAEYLLRLEASPDALLIQHEEGFCVVEIYRPAWSEDLFCEEIAFFVKEPFREKGLGTQWLKESYLWAKEKGVKVFFLNPKLGLPLEFYEKRGFQLVGHKLIFGG